MTIESFPLIKKSEVHTLQVNLGYKCNQACHHCHVDASPARKEMMDIRNINLIPKVLDAYKIGILDLTGGAPEMHPSFKELILESKKLGVSIIDRCNLTILTEDGYEDMAMFLANNNIKIVASLPCYLEDNVDSQRGKGVFEKSIFAIKQLNRLGYGKKGTNLILDLVFNPLGPQLPPAQKSLEESFHKELNSRYGISFNKLIVITNMPIKRFADYLNSCNKLEEYNELLKDNYNKLTLDSLMCLNTISVNWQGSLFDCDFNQQLEMPNNFLPSTLENLLDKKISINGKSVITGSHCFGCTAGNGSSCGGALIK